MLQYSTLYFIPKHKDFLKIQPGTGDNLLPEDIEEGYIDYILWNRFKVDELSIDGELDTINTDSGMIMFKEDTEQDSVLKNVLKDAYADVKIKAIQLLVEKD